MSDVLGPRCQRLCLGVDNRLFKNGGGRIIDKLPRASQKAHADTQPNFVHPFGLAVRLGQQPRGVQAIRARIDTSVGQSGL